MLQELIWIIPAVLLVAGTFFITSDRWLSRNWDDDTSPTEPSNISVTMTDYDEMTGERSSCRNQ